MKKILIVAVFVSSISIASVNVFAQSNSRADLLKEIEAKRAELQRLETQFLTPSAEDCATYAEFLKQPDTGLIRLLPREIFDSEVYKDRKKALTLRGGGAYYSFTHLTHEYGYGSDLELDSNYLSVGFAGMDYGMLLKLGEIPLEEVSIELLKTQFMSTYKPPTLEADVRSEQRRFATGALVDETLYKDRLLLETNSTFLLRSISIDRTDVLVAFRVIRKDADGSAIIAWKLLRRYPKPELARNN